MRSAIISIFLLLLNINCLLAISFNWGKEKAYELPVEEKLMNVRNPIPLNKNRLIEPGYIEIEAEKEYVALYLVFKLNPNNILSLAKINMNKQENTSKEELEKLYNRAREYKKHTAYLGYTIPDSNQFIEFIFSWYRGNENALYRVGSLNEKDQITFTNYKEFILNKNGEIYNSDFTVTRNGYIFGIISVSPDYETEKYDCYYNFGKIGKDSIEWKYDSFNKVLSWAKHEVLVCSLKGSYMLLCSDPSSTEQKYSISSITDDGRFILGTSGTFTDFIVTSNPAYISDLDLIVFPGEYKKDNKWIQAAAIYSIDYENKKLKDKVIQDFPVGAASEFPMLDYLTEAKKILLTKYHNGNTIYYTLADIIK